MKKKIDKGPIYFTQTWKKTNKWKKNIEIGISEGSLNLLKNQLTDNQLDWEFILFWALLYNNQQVVELLKELGVKPNDLSVEFIISLMIEDNDDELDLVFKSGYKINRQRYLRIKNCIDKNNIECSDKGLQYLENAFIIYNRIERVKRFKDNISKQQHNIN